MEDNLQKLLDFLKSQRMMSLATRGDQVSICTVYYAVDQHCNFYFLSEPTREHSRNIRSDNRVACSIADTRQQVVDKKIGVQIKGVAARVSRVDQMKWMLVLWNKANPGFESIINLKNIQKKVIQSRVYRIKPSEIKFFNEALYGPEGVEVFKY